MMEVSIVKSVVRADLYCLRFQQNPTRDTDEAMSGDQRYRFGNHQPIKLNSIKLSNKIINGEEGRKEPWGTSALRTLMEDYQNYHLKTKGGSTCHFLVQTLQSFLYTYNGIHGLSWALGSLLSFHSLFCSFSTRPIVSPTFSGTPQVYSYLWAFVLAFSPTLNAFIPNIHLVLSLTLFRFLLNCY